MKLRILGAVFALTLAISFVAAVYTVYALENVVSRAEFSSKLINELEPEMSGEWVTSPFSDVPEDSPYFGDLLKARAVGLVAGTGDNKFSPDAPLTKEQMYVMLYNAMDIAGKLPLYETMQWVIFDDWYDVSVYAGNNIQTLAKLGLVQADGVEGKIYPKGTVTQEEAEKLIISAFQEKK